MMGQQAHKERQALKDSQVFKGVEGLEEPQDLKEQLALKDSQV